VSLEKDVRELLEAGKARGALILLHGARIRFTLHGDRFSVQAPEGALSEGLAALIKAHREELRTALRQEVNEVWSLGTTALHQAAADGHTSEVRRLLANGADPHKRDKHFQSALHQAAEQGHLECVRLLVDHGARLDEVDMFERTALFAAVAVGREDVARLLVERGAQVNRGDFVGVTPLGLAIGYGYPAIEMLLKDHDAQLDDLTSHTERERMFAGFCTRILKAHSKQRQRHSIRVALISRWLGLHSGCTERELWDLFWGGYLHDMGKQLYPEWVLDKPPHELSDYERHALTYHVFHGYEALAPQDLPYDVKDLVRYHHERWDGQGYLEGLAGEAIPRKARITAVANFFDHKGDLRQAAGHELDPELAQTMAACAEELSVSLNFQCSWWDDYSELQEAS